MAAILAISGFTLRIATSNMCRRCESGGRTGEMAEWSKALPC